MKRDRLIILAAVLFLMAFIVSCSVPEAPVPVLEPSPELTPELTGTPGAREAVCAASSEAVTRAGVRIHYATDEFLAQFEDYYEFVENPDGIRVVITTERTLNSITILELHPSDLALYEWEEPHLEPFEVAHLHWFEWLTPEKPLVLTFMPQCLIPLVGISFGYGEVWPDAGTGEFAIAISGEDGSLSLREFAHRLARSPRTAVTGLLAAPDLAWTEITVSHNIGWSEELWEIIWDTNTLGSEEADRVFEILSTMNAEEVLTPFHYERMSADPMFIIEIRYGDEVIEMIFSSEGGPAFFRWTDTRGDHGDPGYVIGFSEELLSILAATHY
ncbi:MAG: hypothetical protein FWD84_01260 [Oscillospiraceae bacterium]|nr:hypothetical protein [Oscillospiraceae bacterium]